MAHGAGGASPSLPRETDAVDETDAMTDPRPPAGAQAPCPDRAREPLGQFLLRLAPILAQVLVLNTLIAAWLAVIGRYGFVGNLIYSQAIGLSIFIVAVIASRLLRARPDLRVIMVAVPTGSVIGLELASWILGDRVFRAPLGEVLAALALPLAIGTVSTYYFYMRGVLAEQKARLQQTELARAVDRQHLSEARLKTLQAQIEPHFLFNTLSNILNLIEEDPPTARTMLADLTRLLRRSLQRARLDSLTLEEELADIRAYVEIQGQRMGPRLRSSFDIQPGLEAVRMAPYLVQPLVENAIRHGLEPRVGGGELRIRVSSDGETLTIEVADTGVGLRADRPPGLGLSNIRARLAALHGERAGLSLHPNTPCGLIARLRLPVEREAAAA
jgi:sensor histidine kinase YesM